MTARILVVDDEPQIRRVMRTALTAQGYFVMAAKSGDEALDKLRQERFDLALLDVNMPGMNGLETCREIRHSSDIAIIMLTVRNAESDKVAALDSGADDYITKPFSMPELLARIRANLRRLPLCSSSVPPVIGFDGIEINLITRRISIRGRDVRFTPKEFDLLQYLAANPNVSIPHGKLLQAIWGPDYGNEVEYLHVFMNQIRKKIEPDPSKPRYLITEPRFGYRFCIGV
jgi:two-component system, OmpR family, KDP operon response regulator KdpE